MAGDTDLDFVDTSVDGGMDTASTPPSAEDTARTIDPGARPATTSLAKPAGDAPAAIDYPKSWKADYQKHWGAIPRELQEYISGTREKDYLEGLEQYKLGHQSWGRMAEVMNPYMARINSLNSSPHDVVKALLNADWALSSGTPEQKMQMLAQICATYGIDPRQIPGVDPNAAPASPEVLEMRKHYDGMFRGVNEFIQSQVRAQRAAIDKDVAAFAADPAHPHFNDVAEDIVRFINADKSISLQDAYDKAVWANPTTRQKEIERLNKVQTDTDRKAREEAAARAEAARVARVRGKPTEKGTGGKAVGWEEDLDLQAAKITNRTSH